MGLRDAGVELADFIVGKDTDIGQRFKVHYEHPATRGDRLLNIVKHSPMTNFFLGSPRRIIEL